MVDFGIHAYGGGIYHEVVCRYRLRIQIVIRIVSLGRIARYDGKRNVALCQYILHGLRRPAGAENQSRIHRLRPKQFIERHPYSGNVGIVSRAAPVCNLDTVDGPDSLRLGIKCIEVGDDLLLVGYGDVETSKVGRIVDELLYAPDLGQFEQLVRVLLVEALAAEFLGEITCRE